MFHWRARRRHQCVLAERAVAEWTACVAHCRSAPLARSFKYVRDANTTSRRQRTELRRSTAVDLLTHTAAAGSVYGRTDGRTDGLAVAVAVAGRPAALIDLTH